MQRYQDTKIQEGVQEIWRLNHEGAKIPRYEDTRGGSKNLETKSQRCEDAKIQIGEGVQKIWVLNHEDAKMPRYEDTRGG